MTQRIIMLFAAVMLTAAANAQTAVKTNPKKEKTVTAPAPQYPKGSVVIETSLGSIVIALDDAAAPKHAANFRKLAKEGYYDSTTFHRVIPGFMIQGGDPNSKSGDRSTHGMGGPDHRIDAEIGLSHDRGVIAAARQANQVNPEMKSNGSQFYITVADAKFLDGQYSVFGRVVAGMETADRIVAVKRDMRDNPVEKVLIQRMTVVE